MTTMPDHDQAMRCLGARDGFAQALVRLRMTLLAKYRDPNNHIPAAHTRKIARRDRELAPLVEFEQWLAAQVTACQDGWKKFGE
jgi:hypothetical protein